MEVILQSVDSNGLSGMDWVQADIDGSFAFPLLSVCLVRLSCVVLLSSTGSDSTTEIIHHLDLPPQP